MEPRKQQVYLETSFFRYLVAPLSKDQLRISPTVYDEFYRDAIPRIPAAEAAERLALLGQAPQLPMGSAILELTTFLVEPAGPIPKRAEADALHWAVASHFGCEYILTWNFRYLNNAAIKRRAERIITAYGYRSPTLCSPEEME